jgi:ornithine cyclodeaminase/alanine dehydrogenase-like protein (mu-crystallin family)
MLLLNNTDVEKLLDMKTCLEALEVGYKDLVAGNAVHRPRIDVWAPCDRQDGYFRWGSMEGACRTYGVFATRMKSDIVCWPEGENEIKYCIQPGTFCGLIMLFSTKNGEPLAIINDGVLQHMRVGACAGLGVKYLARDDAKVVGIIGSGGMARAYLRAFAEVRPLKRVKVYSRSAERREKYAAEMGSLLGIPVEPFSALEPVVRGSDIVATCTDSIVPVLSRPEWIEPGMHLTSLDIREFATDEVYERCDVVIRLGDFTLPSIQQEAAFRPFHFAGYAAGQPEELSRIPKSKVKINTEKYPTLLDLLTGKVTGRTSPNQITSFINSGTQGLHFASVAGMVYRVARERGMGRELPTEWFVQDIRD